MCASAGGRINTGFFVHLYISLSQAAECLRCLFAPWAARFARADRTDKARPRRWLCCDLSALAVGGRAACLERSSPPLPKARGRLGPCGHGPAECLRCQFAPRGGELTLALDRAGPSRPRRWFCRDLSGLAERKKPACLGCNPRGRALTSRSSAAFSRRSVARLARGATPACRRCVCKCPPAGSAPGGCPSEPPGPGPAPESGRRSSGW